MGRIQHYTSDGIFILTFNLTLADGNVSVSVSLEDGIVASLSGRNDNQDGNNNAFWWAVLRRSASSGGDNNYTVTFSQDNDALTIVLMVLFIQIVMVTIMVQQ